jgi:ribosomal protein S18 acetylase RimI-like enzyme
MVASAVSKSKTTFRGIRPFRARTDLYGVARLLEEAFRSEHRFPFSRFPWLREISIFLWTLSYLPTFPETIEGFVWIEDEQVVGNVTVTRDETQGNWYYISNVAVKKEYQRRGIARALMQAALEHIRRQHAARVRLNVRPQNEGAIKLYQELGFKTLETRAQWTLSTLPLRLPTNCVLHLRALHTSDARAVRELMRAVTPADIRPFHARIFEPEWDEQLAEWIGNAFLARTTQRWALERDHRLAALLFVCAHTWLAPNHIIIEVHPDFRGRVEDDLILAAWQILARFPPREIRADASSLHPELTNALERHGFYFSNGMTLMELVM